LSPKNSLKGLLKNKKNAVYRFHRNNNITHTQREGSKQT
jgi:hypothetical protein